MHEAGELAVYRTIDTAIGRILEAVDEPAFIVLVSDHGEKPATRMVPLPAVLEAAGLLARRDDGAIDYGRSEAAPHGACYVSLNLQGREPEGVVAPRRRPAVRERVIAALQGYRDPETGLCPFSLVLRKEDARILGLYGDGVGDVVYAVREEFSDDHGQVLGTGEAAGGSLRSLLALRRRRGAARRRRGAPRLAHRRGADAVSRRGSPAAAGRRGRRDPSGARRARLTTGALSPAAASYGRPKPAPSCRNGPCLRAAVTVV